MDIKLQLTNTEDVSIHTVAVEAMLKKENVNITKRKRK